MWKFCRKHPRVVLCFMLLQAVSLLLVTTMARQDDAYYQTMGRTPDGISVLLSFWSRKISRVRVDCSLSQRQHG